MNVYKIQRRDLQVLREMLVEIFNVSGERAGVKSAIIKLGALIERTANEALKGVRIALGIQNHFCHYFLFLV